MLQHLGIYRTIFAVRTFQVARAHQKFVHNLAADKFKLLFKELHPFFFAARVVGIEPLLKRAVFGLQRQNLLRVVNGRVDL